jgi:DNA-binding response OmpR family regulator
MNGDKRILVVDDEVKIVQVVKSYLEKSGYPVCEAYNGREALAIFGGSNVSLVVLDLMLPDMAGEEVCATIRKRSRVPIIMLTAKVEEQDILRGLGIGADDYLTKPFSPRELVARVAAIFRRTENEPVPLSDILSFGDEDLVVDNLRHEVRKKGANVKLTPNEYSILITMAKFPTKVFTREELIDMVFGDGFGGYSRAVDSHISNIRQKIESDVKNPSYILTVHGVGYKFGGE